MDKLDDKIPAGRPSLFRLAALCVLGAAALANFLALAWHIAFYTIEVPYEDEWGNLWRIVNRLSNRPVDYSFWDGAHRCPIPRYIQYHMAVWTRWNMNYETALNLLFAVMSFACFMIFVRRIRMSGFLQAALAAAVSFCVFSSRGYLDWIWGEQGGRALNLAAAAAGLALLSRPDFRWRDLAAGVFLGVIANYSCSSGIAYWPAALAPLAVKEYRSPALKARALAVWCVSAAAAVGFYVQGYTPSGEVPHMMDFQYHFLQEPAGFFGYMLVFLGNPALPYSFASAEPLPLWAGIFAAELFVIPSLYLLFRKPALRRPVTLFMAPGLYALFNAFAAGLGRAAYGIRHAANPQYSCVANFFWVSLFMLGALCLEEFRRERRRGLLRAAGAVYAAAVLSIVVTSFLSFSELRSGSDRVREMSRRFLTTGDSAVNLLRRNRLTVFRDEKALRRYFRIQGELPPVFPASHDSRSAS